MLHTPFKMSLKECLSLLTGEPLVQRTVVVQRDEKGYGLTVSGDNPVFVQSVKPDGAAERAGVKEGDRIIKVNGSLVAQSNHKDVVRLIKSQQLVQLTLLGPPPYSTDSTPPTKRHTFLTSSHSDRRTTSTHHSTSPNDRRTRASSVQIGTPSNPFPPTPDKAEQCRNEGRTLINRMLQNEQTLLQTKRDEYVRNPTEALHQQLISITNRVRDLQQKSFSLPDLPDEIVAPVEDLVPSKSTPAVADFAVASPNQHHSPTTPACLPPVPIINSISPPPPSDNSLESTSLDATSPSSSNDPPFLSPDDERTSSLDQMNVETGADPDTRTVDGPTLVTPSSSSLDPSSVNLFRKRNSQDEGVGGGITRNLSNASKFLQSAVKQKFSNHRRQRSSPETFFQQLSDFGETLTMEKKSLTQSDLSTAGLNDIEPQIIVVGTPETMKEAWPVTSRSDSNDTFGDSPVEVEKVSPTQVTVIRHATENVTPTLQEPVRIPPMQARDIMSAEDDDLYDTDILKDPGPYSNLTLLMSKPGHMAVFMTYLISNSDPSALFFLIVADNYTSGTLKEMKKWSYEIFSTFLAPSAPLKVNVDDSVVLAIEETSRTRGNNEEGMRGVFRQAQTIAQEDVKEHLATFQNRRAMGLSYFFGDDKLQDNLDKPHELKIVEEILGPQLENVINSEANQTETDRNSAIASSIVTYMKLVGCKPQMSSVNNSLDRCQSFVNKDKPKFRLRSNKKVHYIKGHHYVGMQFTALTQCQHCNTILWGIGNQGLQCQTCCLNMHKHCADQSDEPCPGSEGKKARRDRGPFRKIITRKPSDANEKKNRIREERSQDNEDGPVPNQGNNIRSMHDGDTESDLTDVKSGVGNQIKKFEQMNESDMVGAPLSPTDDKGNDAYLGSNLLNRSNTLGRSESLKVRGEGVVNTRFPNKGTTDICRSQSDVDENLNTSGLVHSASSSASSLSTGCDSPSQSLETMSMNTGSFDEVGIVQKQEFDSDLEAENDTPNWHLTIDKAIIKPLKPREIKRQEIINELFHTERTHVRNLKILNIVYYRPMIHEKVLPTEIIEMILPNVETLIRLHGLLNTQMKIKRKENAVVDDVSDILLERFEGTEGDEFKEACAKFCSRQSIGLEALKQRMKKDQKLAQFMADVERNTLCRRLTFQAVVATGYQRLTKYPLLLENLLKYTPPSNREYDRIKRCIERCKAILNFVNESVKESENHHRLMRFQEKLDRSALEKSTIPMFTEFKNLDLTRRKLVYDGPLTWKINRTKMIELHVLLMEDILVLMQKQDERYILKFQSTTVTTATEDAKVTHSPVLKLSNLFTRYVANDNKALFLVSTSNVGPQIYEMVAQTPAERKIWFQMITEAVENHKKLTDAAAVLKSGIPSPVRNSRPLPPVPSTVDVTTPAPKPTKSAESAEENDHTRVIETTPAIATGQSAHDDRNVKEAAEVDMMIVVAEKIEPLSEKTELVHPREVSVADPMLASEVAIPVLSPMEKFRKNTEVLNSCLHERRELLTTILNVSTTNTQLPIEIQEEGRSTDQCLFNVMQTFDVLLEEITASNVLLGDLSPTNPDIREVSPTQSNVVAHNSRLIHLSTVLNERLIKLLGFMQSAEQPTLPPSPPPYQIDSPPELGNSPRGPILHSSTSTSTQFITSSFQSTVTTCETTTDGEAATGQRRPTSLCSIESSTSAGPTSSDNECDGETPQNISSAEDDRNNTTYLERTSSDSGGYDTC